MAQADAAGVAGGVGEPPSSLRARLVVQCHGVVHPLQVAAGDHLGEVAARAQALLRACLHRRDEILRVTLRQGFPPMFYLGILGGLPAQR